MNTEERTTHEFNLDFNTLVENLVLTTIEIDPAGYRIWLAEDY